MPFIIKKSLDHGTTNPIVARLSLQVLTILDQCSLTKEARDKIGAVFVDSLAKKLLRCWEIEDRYRKEFNAAVGSYKLPATGSKAIEVPQIPRLEEECHNFLYEAKNYIRDLLGVVNLLYGTSFIEASEFSRAKKGSRSLVEFAVQTFGEQDPKTRFLREAVLGIETLIGYRNAVEHPNGYSGVLRIENFSLDPDGKIAEPAWYQEIGGTPVTEPSSIRSDMDVMIHNLLTLAEDVLVSWAESNLKLPKMMRMALVPAEQRDPNCPVKWKVTLSHELEKKLSSLEKKKK